MGCPESHAHQALSLPEEAVLDLLRLTGLCPQIALAFGLQWLVMHRQFLLQRLDADGFAAWGSLASRANGCLRAGHVGCQGHNHRCECLTCARGDILKKGLVHG